MIVIVKSLVKHGMDHPNPKSKRAFISLMFLRLGAEFYFTIYVRMVNTITIQNALRDDKSGAWADQYWRGEDYLFR